MKVIRFIKRLFPEMGAGTTKPICPCLGALIIAAFIVLSWVALWLEFTIGRYRVLCLGITGLASLYLLAWALRRHSPRLTIADDFRVRLEPGSRANRQALRHGLESLLALTILISILCFYLSGVL